MKVTLPFQTGRSRRLLVPVALLLALLVALPTLAQEPVTDDEVNEIAREVYCPVCESTPLDVCETQACADWRELIRTKLGEGQTREEIFDYFARQYGDRVLASPPKEGFNLIVWLWPIVALALGAVFFGRLLSNLRSKGDGSALTTAVVVGPAEETQPPEKDDYAARVERELTER